MADETPNLDDLIPLTQAAKRCGMTRTVFAQRCLAAGIVRPWGKRERRVYWPEVVSMLLTETVSPPTRPPPPKPRRMPGSQPLNRLVRC